MPDASSNSAIVGYGPSTAGKAFDPPISDRAIKAALRSRELAAYRVGRRTVILARDLMQWVSNHRVY